MTQFSLFGAEAVPPDLADLDGVLLAGGRWVTNGDGARVSVVVADRWRADALAAAFVERGVGAGDDAVVPATAGLAARTGFCPELVAAAGRWTRGANQGLPRAFELGPGGLRLWALAAGRRVEAGYLLATGSADEVVHQAAGAQLSRLGVAAASLTRRADRGWRVTSSRRLRRLVELLGPAPAGGEQDWPSPVRPWASSG